MQHIASTWPSFGDSSVRRLEFTVGTTSYEDCVTLGEFALKKRDYAPLYRGRAAWTQAPGRVRWSTRQEYESQARCWHNSPSFESL